MGKRCRSWNCLLLISFLSLLEVQLVELASLKLNECELNNYSPCRCSQNEQGILIFCEELHPAQVQNVFNQSKSSADLHFIYLSLSKTATLYQITSDVLSGRRTEFIQIECPSSRNKDLHIQIDLDAFRSTSTKTTNFDIRDCDLSRLDFNFLRGFNRLKSFTIESCSNIEQSIRTLPGLPALEQLDISMSNGLADSSFRNLDEVALGTLKLEDNDDLNDHQVVNILKSLTSRSIASMRSLQLAGNQLTVVPSEVALFRQLNSINLGNNKITQLIDGQFKFDVPVSRLHLDHNSISSIASGAFQGNFGSARVFLAENNLTRFEESVFKAMLQQMVTGTGQIYIDTNPFNCDCHLAWLIRDNRELMKVVEGGKCSNGTYFDRLNQKGFDECKETSMTNRSVLNEHSTLAPENSAVTPSTKEEDKATVETRSMIHNSTLETTTEDKATHGTISIVDNHSTPKTLAEMISTTESAFNKNISFTTSDVISVTHATATTIGKTDKVSEKMKVESTSSFQSSSEKWTTMDALDTTPPPATQIPRDVTDKPHQMTTLISNQQTSLMTKDNTSAIQPDWLTNSTSDGVPVSQVMPSTVSIGSTTSESKTVGFTMAANGTTSLPSVSASTEMPISSSEPSTHAMATNSTTLPLVLTSTEMTSITEPSTAGPAMTTNGTTLLPSSASVTSTEMPVSAAITTNGTSVSSVIASTEIATTSKPSTGYTAMTNTNGTTFSTEITSTLQPSANDTKNTTNRDMKHEELSTTSVTQQSELAATSSAPTTSAPTLDLIQTTENAVTPTLLPSIKVLASDEPTTEGVESRASGFESSSVTSEPTTSSLPSTFEATTTRIINESTVTEENASSLLSTESTLSMSNQTVQTTNDPTTTTASPTSSTISNLNSSATAAATSAPSTFNNANVTATPTTTERTAKTSFNSNSVISTSVNVTFSAPSGAAGHDSVPSPIVGASGVVTVSSSSLTITVNHAAIALVAVINLLAR